MHSKERILNTLTGKETDRVPVSPFLAYWWESQTDTFTEQGELEFLESVGADPLFRGHWPMIGKNYEDMLLFKKEIKDCEIRTKTSGREKHVTFETSCGSLDFGYRYTPESNSWFLVDHPVEDEEDFKILRHIIENTLLTPDYKRFDAAAKQLGRRGLLVPIITPELKSSFQSLLEHWCGTENLVYALLDFPEAVLETLNTMQELSMKGAKISADSNAEAFLSWEDTSTTNISPQFYRDYILPEINGWCDILHASDKLYVQHACGLVNDLLIDIAGSKIDALESITPAPLGNVEMERVRDVFPKHMAVIGGIGGIQFLNQSEDEIEEESRLLLDQMKNTRYILANSDSCPPGVSIEKFRRLSKAAREHKSI